LLQADFALTFRLVTAEHSENHQEDEEHEHGNCKKVFHGRQWRHG
jgi:hypothetical protein